jgi:hypothetical protein
MAKIREIKAGNGIYEFYCDGCKCMHQVWTNPNETPCWRFNGDTSNPTFSPSVLVTMPNRTEMWENDICHFFIQNGEIQYLSDCTHELKDKILELRELK